MVSATVDEGRLCTLVLRPNQSLSWRGTKLIYCGMLAVALPLASGFAILGFWPILPFAGGELALLAAALYVCQLRALRVEVITVDGERVAVDRGRAQAEERVEFARHWVRVELRRSRYRGHLSRLVLTSHGRQVSIGDFLVEDERRLVASELRRALGAGSPEQPHRLGGNGFVISQEDRR
jgi:uncharacterized membrane protein